MESVNNEKYHELTKATMEDIFSHLGFRFIHKYINSGHDLYAISTGKYQCNITAIEEKQAFKNSFDWYKMTEQDEMIWQEIFNVLDN